MVLEFKIDTADYDSEENVLNTLKCILAMLDCTCPDNCELASNLNKQMKEQLAQNDVYKNAKMFYEVLKVAQLDQYKDDENVEDLFKYWVTADYAYFNSTLLNLIQDTGRLDWIKVREWCDKAVPIHTDSFAKEVEAWKSIISN